jgi:D-glycero-D-manno-heptose 1,7-bisphosphate phosphatase
MIVRDGNVVVYLPMPRPAIFLDRDGTLIEERNYISRADQVALFPGAADSLIQLRRAGYVCVVVTNQSGLGRGLFGEKDLEAVHEEMQRQLRQAGARLDGLYHCPIAPKIKDKTIIEHRDRKPGPGMLLRAARELDLDLFRSWMIGDSASDILAGRHAGCRGGILLRSGHDVLSSLAHLGPTDVVVDNLPAATRWILGDLSEPRP